MTRYNHFIRILVLAGFITAGMVLTAIVTAAILLLNGWSLPELMNMDQGSLAVLSPGITRWLLAIQHICFFIVPSILFGIIIYGKKFPSGLGFSNPINWKAVIFGLFFLAASYPLVNLSFLVNEAIPLPEWAKALENQAEDTLKAILDMKTPLIFIFNLILIGILPGIGEELVFRGILQKELSGFFRNPFVGIWVAAFIFSAIHLQFEGFFPRLALGAVLGYLFYWSGNLWIPILVHAFNNGFQVVLIYITGSDITSIDETGSDQLTWWMIPLCVFIMYYLHLAIQKQRNGIEQI